MRRTKEELQKAKRDKWVSDYIKTLKFLADAKYYKNNYWNMAAWDSWAAQGKAGGCRTCTERHYNGSLCNTRAANKSCKQVSGNFCYDCISLIEEKINHKFSRH